ncbi:hypothetical protein RSWS8N_18264 [Cereibacter sphaeroides WS8N]|uniref:hypothetical protein n=1 Tax=Cereibacter sphaeroides TaxID=1063 RepID=UPI00020B02EE|nr:hypothetical protein [Cereibacter sphaeroides]EGJ20073.1 hypothetical protein RSWS8N_17974 [Cereibacter sphaeroides WS8N]EGJ20131.1 hypothetical protein RSWS8N_18264 [Cereibacter sphaeroides WS8N]
MSNTVVLTRGSDLGFSGTWTDEAGAALDLTGWSIEAFDAHPALAPQLSMAFGNAAQGHFTGLIAWCDAFPRTPMAFRVRIVSAEGARRASPPITVRME